MLLPPSRVCTPLYINNGGEFVRLHFYCHWLLWFCMWTGCITIVIGELYNAYNVMLRSAGTASMFWGQFHVDWLMDDRLISIPQHILIVNGSLSSSIHVYIAGWTNLDYWDILITAVSLNNPQTQECLGCVGALLECVNDIHGQVHIMNFLYSLTHRIRCCTVLKPAACMLTRPPTTASSCLSLNHIFLPQIFLLL